jgi:hypothetical protein
MEKIIASAKKGREDRRWGPPTAALRKQYQERFEKRFGVELELVSGIMPDEPQRVSRPGFTALMFYTAARRTAHAR